MEASDGTPAARPRRRGGLRRSLVLRIMASGLVAIVGSVLLLGVQIQLGAKRDAAADVQRRTDRAAADLSALFGRWHDELLVAAQDAALADWFAAPGRRGEDIAQINAMMIRLHTIYPDLIDEACFIAASGTELARQVRGTAAAPADLSPDESQSSFFKDSFAVAEGEVFQGTPYVSEDSERWVVPNATPIVVGGQKVAILHFETNLDAVRAVVHRTLGPGMQARIVDAGLGKVLADTGVERPIVKDPFPAASAWSDAAGPIRSAVAVGVDSHNANRWRIEVSAPNPNPFTGALLAWTLAGVLVAMLAVAAVAYRVATAIARPVVQVTEATERIVATGDRHRRVQVRARDELGRLSRSIDTMLDWLENQDAEIQRVQEAREAQLRANWEKQQEAERHVRTRAQSVINDTTGGITRELAAVREHVDAVRATGRSIDERVGTADAATAELVSRAGRAGEVLGAFTASLQRVDGIAKLISGVAGQTNLLALNATIEAARAGEAGKGFAVVADEVKNLANETARSSADITATIRTLEHDAAETTAMLGGMVEGIRGIRDATNQVQHVVADQTTTVERLEGAVGEALHRIESMARVTDEMERRTSERYMMDGPVVLGDGRGGRREATLVDLSDGGLRCVPGAGAPPAAGQVLEVELPLQGRTLRLSARVAHLHGDGTVGMQFLDPPGDAVAHIRRAVAELLQHA